MFVTWLSFLGGGGNGGEVTNEKALKPVTTVQNSASTFLSVKQLFIVDKGPQCFDIC